MNDAVSMAVNAGLSPELAAYMPRYIQIESGGNPNAQTGSYSGLLQMGPDEMRRYGGNGLGSGVSMYADNANWFQNKFGRAPTPTELYLVANQGRGGLPAHMANPNAPAWQNMYSTAEGQDKGPAWARKAIWGNVPDDLKSQFGNVDNVTSQNYLDLWKHKVERAPMNTAFAQNTQGKTPMADYGPALSPGAIAGGPGAMYGGPQATPLGGFANFLKMLGVGSNEDIGRKLQNAGGGLIAVGNPSGGAALQNAANAPLFRQKYSMTVDAMGNRYILNNHTGQIYNAFGQPLGGNPEAPMAGNAGGAVGGGAAAAPSMSPTQMDAQSPVARQERAKKYQEDSAKKMEALEEAASQAQATKDMIEQQAMPLSKDPNVAQGAGAHAKYGLKNWTNTLTLGEYGSKGLSQTADLDKLNQQLVAQNLAMQKGVRFASPEIKFGQSASADLEKPSATNQQIYSNYLQTANRVLALRDIARRHMSRYGVLGPEYSAEVQKYQNDNPTYQMDQVTPSGSEAPAGFKVLKVH